MAEAPESQVLKKRSNRRNSSHTRELNTDEMAVIQHMAKPEEEKETVELNHDDIQTLRQRLAEISRWGD